jgi:hypothetical protein
MIMQQFLTLELIQHEIKTFEASLTFIVSGISPT